MRIKGSYHDDLFDNGGAPALPIMREPGGQLAEYMEKEAIDIAIAQRARPGTPSSCETPLSLREGR
jgi:hypothetical protein